MTPDQYAMAIGAGALTGFICAVPVGPVNVAIMEEGIHSGRKPNSLPFLPATS